MIAQLRGRIVCVDGPVAVVDVGGVGYEVFCHLRTLARLHETATADVVLHVHTAVSDEAIRLFGFTSPEELRLFRLLLGVERIGPRAALAILGRAELPTLVRALRGGDAKLLATVPGIGPKTAERVVLELRDRLDGLLLPGDAGRDGDESPDRQAAALAVAGLAGLGFRESDARAAVAAAVPSVGSGADVNALVAAALRRLDPV